MGSELSIAESVPESNYGSVSCGLTTKSRWTWILRELLSNFNYAVERGLNTVAIPFHGDLDLLLSERDRNDCLETLKNSGMLLYAASSYGGVRVFLREYLGEVKRLDITWKLHYRGVPLLDVERLLAESVVDMNSGLKILPERSAMEIACAIKNAYGGAEKYRTSMEKYGLSVLSSRKRVAWIVNLVMVHPLGVVAGATRCFLQYIRRFWRPTGLMVKGGNPSILNQSLLLRYLSQSREIRQYGFLVGYFRSRVMSELCVVRRALFADINLSGYIDSAACEREIVEYLRERRVALE